MKKRRTTEETHMVGQFQAPQAPGADADGWLTWEQTRGESVREVKQKIAREDPEMRERWRIVEQHVVVVTETSVVEAL